MLPEVSPMTEDDGGILVVDRLVKLFPVHGSFGDRLRGRPALHVHAVDGVSLAIAQNETLGVVGESGSGKTTLGRTVLMLEKPTSGTMTFAGRQISSLSGDQLRQLRKRMQIVFQNPYSSLDPRARVKDIVAEPLRAFGSPRNVIDGEVERVLEAVNLPEDSVFRFPHEFSGGQRQRIAIARALVVSPEFVVLDEPTSALDSSVQAQILNLLRKIQDDMGLSFMLITHNVDVVKFMAHRIAVMYCGKFVEVGATRAVLESPLHPYTALLVASVPRPDPTKKVGETAMSGEVPSAVNPPAGCRFNPRCPYAQDVCRREEPPLREVAPGRWSACHFAEDLRDGLKASTSAAGS
ncbi:MAG: ABC transporter ATP-binding protein [Nitrososphaerales archaeon]|jgi:oligopeptide/dipeptide ABC transporter ATP-binding protein